MFGYVYVNAPELRIREFDRYRAYYCGLCKALKKEHGNFSRLTLNYDMVFLVMFLTSLYEPDVTEEDARCFLHPLKRHREVRSVMTDYAADMNLLLYRYNMIDDWEDDRNILKGLGALMLRYRTASVERKYPEKTARIREHLVRLSGAEKAGEEDIDVPASEFGHIMGEVFLYDDKDPMREDIYNCGFHLGRFIYICDAYIDRAEDERKGRYNALKGRSGEDIRSMLETAASSCAASFESLPMIDDIEIMRNIIYAGCWTRYEAARKRGTDESI